MYALFYKAKSLNQRKADIIIIFSLRLLLFKLKFLYSLQEDPIGKGMRSIHSLHEEAALKFK